MTTTTPQVPDEELLHRYQAVGDPLADAAAHEVAGRAGAREEWAAGLASGAATIAPGPVRDLLAHLEATARSADDADLAVAARAAYTVPLAVHVFDVGAGALLRSYTPPAPAEVLVGTGRLTGHADERLASTARWLNAASAPGWLRVGEPGFTATAHVRLGHASARRAALARGLGGTGGPVPLNQVDMVRTWLDFALAAPLFSEALGMALDDAEHRDLLRYWRHLGALLGIEPGLLAGAVDRASAQELDERIAAMTGPPNAASRTLTAAGLSALSRGLRDVSGLPERLTSPVVAAIARAMQGPATSNALGIPRSGPLGAVVPLVAAVLRARRRRLRARPAAWDAAVERNIALGRRFVLTGELPSLLPSRARGSRGG